MGLRATLAHARAGDYLHAVQRITFLPVASPKLRPSPPSGPEWLHEVKFDGFRIQLHKSGNEVRLFSGNGKDFTDRFPTVTAAVAALPTAGAVIDGEIVAYDETGKPDFYTLLLRRASGVCPAQVSLRIGEHSQERPATSFARRPALTESRRMTWFRSG